MTLSRPAAQETESAVTWQITEHKVQAAVERIVATARPQAVIVFGSYARHQARPGSDLDLFVIVDDDVISCRAESVKLRRALRGISMPVDIIVARRGDVEHWRHTMGLVYETALTEGWLAYERG